MVKKLKKQLVAHETVLKYIAEHFVKGLLGFKNKLNVFRLEKRGLFLNKLSFIPDLQIVKH